LAANKGHISVVEYLVNQNAEIDAKDQDAMLFKMISLLFIVQLKKVFIGWLSILLIRKQM